MSPDVRNTKVVVALVVSMTVGAALLLWLQPRTFGWSPDTRLMAERGSRVESVWIEYARPDQPMDPGEYDCIIFPDGQCDWRPRSPNIRLVTVGSGAANLEEPQARTLLAALGSLYQKGGLDLVRVRLAPESDAQQFPDLPPQAHELRALLVRKGIIP